MFAEDLSPFFNAAEFAVPATIGLGSAVNGIFDNGYSAGQVGAMGMASTQPSFVLPTASVPDAAVGQPLVVNTLTYCIVAHEPDGTGVSTLYLERTP
jgi:hypothetical protein